MSPTSRWSRNWTPLTTRPSFTSRHGMILRAGKAEGLLQRDATFPQRLADDGAVGSEALQIGQRRNAARRLNLHVRQPIGDLVVQIEIWAVQHAVTADVGDEQVASIRKLTSHIVQALAAVFGPAGGRHQWHSAHQSDVERKS